MIMGKRDRDAGDVEREKKNLTAAKRRRIWEEAPLGRFEVAKSAARIRGWRKSGGGEKPAMRSSEEAAGARCLLAISVSVA